jgi:hypothetical protein
VATIAVRQSVKKRRRGRIRLARLEVLLAVPALALVILCVAQAAAVFDSYRSLSDAVRAGAQTAAVSRTAPDPTGATILEVRTTAGDLDQSVLSVGVSSTWLQGDQVEVVARYPYEISVLGFTLKSGHLESSQVERVQ